MLTGARPPPSPPPVRARQGPGAETPQGRAGKTGKIDRRHCCTVVCLHAVSQHPPATPFHLQKLGEVWVPWPSETEVAGCQTVHSHSVALNERGGGGCVVGRGEEGCRTVSRAGAPPAIRRNRTRLPPPPPPPRLDAEHTACIPGREGRGGEEMADDQRSLDCPLVGLRVISPAGAY